MRIHADMSDAQDRHCPLAALYAALILGAVKDILQYERRKLFFYRGDTEATRDRRRKDRLLALRAREWIDGGPAPVTFLAACEAADVDPESIRAKLRDGLEEVATIMDAFNGMTAHRDYQLRKAA